MELYEALKSRKGLPVSDSFALLFGRQTGGGGGSDVEYFGTVPFEINAKGNQNAKEYTIYGNTYQAAVPTPDNPVEIQGTGDYDEETGKYKIPVVNKVKNLFDGNSPKNIENRANVEFPDFLDFVKTKIEPNTYYTASWDIDVGFTSMNACFVVSTQGNKWITNRTTFSFTKEYIDSITTILIYGNAQKTWSVVNFQVELGTTATAYVPYRQPITTTIYTEQPLFGGDFVKKNGGNVEHREYAIKVFDGSENWTSFTSYEAKNCFMIYSNFGKGGTADIYSTHFVTGGLTTVLRNVGYAVYSSGSYSYMIVHSNGLETIADFKQWLKSEYDAGHPVTVWYQLETPTEKSVDLPQIQLADGFNNIDVDTSVKPEAVQIKFKGEILSQQASLQALNDEAESTNNFETEESELIL